MVADAVCGQVQIPQRVGMFQMNVAHDYPYFVAIAPQGFKEDNPAVGAALSQVIMPWPSPITLTLPESAIADSGATGDSTSSGVKVEVLVQSSPRSWTTGEPFNLSPTQEWQMPTEGIGRKNLMVHLSGDFVSYFKGRPVPAVGEASEDDTLSQIQLSAEDTDREIDEENTNAHLIVAGDSDFLSNQNATPGNVTLLQNLVDWLTLDENLIHIRSRAMVDRTLRHERLGEGSTLPTVVRWVNILLMPLLLIAVGMVIYMKRREPVTVTASTPSKPEEKKE